MNEDTAPIANIAELRRKNAEDGFRRLWNMKAIDAITSAAGTARRTSVPPQEEFVAAMAAANPNVG